MKSYVKKVRNFLSKERVGICNHRFVGSAMTQSEEPEDLADNDLSAVIRDNEYLTFDVHATDTSGGPLINTIRPRRAK